MSGLLAGGLHGLVVLVTALIAAPAAGLVFWAAWRWSK